jgi:3-phenylpropionate/trans-cinnamate dioxygenase ferredoxin reductase subunit
MAGTPRAASPEALDASGPGVVIVGAGLAGATAAQTLRDEGYRGPVVLVGDEPDRPYERPPLSKDYLLGKAGRDTVFVHPERWYAENAVGLRLGTQVVAIDRGTRHVVLAVGERLPYDRLLLTTGSTPRLLSVPGADLEGVQYLRRLPDSDQIRTAFEQLPRVVIIGAGWIGLETAAAARAAGLDVTVLEAADQPLQRVLGRRMAQVFADLHHDHGVDLRCGVQVSHLTGTDAHVDGVVLAGGARLDAELVLVGVGITPNTELARAAGLEADHGITVDEHLRTADPFVYAAGDVANARHPLLGRHLRVEHWANARRQGAVAARSLLGQGAGYDRLPYFYSDQYDLGMEYTGYVDPTDVDDVVVRGDVAGRQFIAFWTSGGRVTAGMNVNTWDVTGPIETLVRSGRLVDPGRLADPDVPLTSV